MKNLKLNNKKKVKKRAQKRNSRWYIEPKGLIRSVISNFFYFLFLF
jgi:hypothetical protein